MKGTTGNAIEEVVIPDSVKRIGYGAFQNCKYLTSIDIPKNVSEIGDSAFSGCVRLGDVVFHENVETEENEDGEKLPFSLIIGNGVFSDCKELTGIQLPVQTVSVGWSFISGTGITEIVVPEGIVRCGVNGNGVGPFGGAGNLKKVIFEEGTKEILDRMCSEGTTGNAIEEVIIPDSVARIGDSAFSGCTGIVNVDIPNNIKEIGYGAFQNCKYLTSIDIPKNVSEIGDSAFSGCVRLGDVVFHENVETEENEDGEKLPFSLIIGNGVFSDCKELTEIQLPVQTVSVGWSFISGTGITEIVVPEGIVRCGVNGNGVGPFGGAGNLKKVIFEEGTKEILDRMCGEGNAIEEVVIPDSVKRIGYGAFRNCKYLANIDIPKNVSEIGDSAFSGCVRLGDVVFHENVETEENEDGEKLPFSLVIGNGVFSDCKELTGIQLPVQTVSVGWSFISGTGITEIVVPKGIIRCGVNGNGVGPFGGAGNLKKVIFEEGTKEILDRMCGEGTIGNVIEEVVIPTSVIKIGDNSFYNCSNVTIYGWFDSYAEIYANDHNIPFASIDDLVEDDGGDNQNYMLQHRLIMTLDKNFCDGQKMDILKKKLI